MTEPARVQSADLARLRIDRGDDGPGGAGTFVKVAVALAAVAVLGAGGWAAWSRFLKPAPSVRVFRVSVAGPAGARSLEASGYLVPQKRAEVATKVAGVVARVHVDEGDAVVEGQPLAELKNAEEAAAKEEARIECEEARALYAAAQKALDEMAAQKTALEGAIAEAAAARETARWTLEAAEAKLVEARRDFERKKALRATNDVGEAELDAAESSWKSAEAQVQGAKSGIREAESRGAQAAANVEAALARWHRNDADLKAAEARVRSAEARFAQSEARFADTVIRSPISGRVTARKIHPGEAASPAGITTGTRGGALFTVADFATLEAEVDVNETRLSELRAAHPARVSVDAVPGKRYRGELRQIVPTADRQRAVVRVRVRLLDADAALLPEMAVRATFMENAAEAVADDPVAEVPREALVRDGGKSYVWVIVGGKASRREVGAGPEKDGRVAVKTGLSNGDLVVVANAVPMSEGLAVKAEER